MAMTNKEKDQAYRERLYNAGYKQMRIWVPRNSEKEPIKTERRFFLKMLEALTAGWSKAKMSRLFSEILEAIKEKTKEEN